MAWPDWDTPLSKQDVSPRELRLAQNEIDALPAGVLSSTSKGPVASNPATGYSPALGAGGEISCLDPAYGVKGDGNFLTDGTITAGQAVLSTATSLLALANPPKIGQLISVIGVGAGAGITAVPLVTTILSVNLAAKTITLNATATNSAAGTATVFYASDDTTALRAWLADLNVKGERGRMPSRFYGINGTLTLTNQTAVCGTGAREIWGSIGIGGGNNGWFEGTVPYINGSVFWQFAAADALLVSAVASTVELMDFGILFTNLYNGAGHGINVAPSPLLSAKFDTGIVSANWSNIKVFGHDGNHYGFVLNNPLLCTFTHLHSAGGGALKVHGEGQNNYGNCVFDHVYGLTITGGTADTCNLSGDAITFGKLNLLVFNRPNFSNLAPSPALQGNTPVTAAQRLWFADNFVNAVTSIGEDLETNVGSAVIRNANIQGGWAIIGSFGGGSDTTLMSRAGSQKALAIYGNAGGQTVDAVSIYPRGGWKAFAVDSWGRWVAGMQEVPTSGTLGANVTSVTPAGNDTIGKLTVVMSGALAANTKIATITFAHTYGATAPYVRLTNETFGAGLATVDPYVQAQATGVSFDIACNQALAAGTYTFGYIAIGATST